MIFLAGIVRLFFVLGFKSRTISGDFSIKKYFDSRHLIRWVGHFVTAYTLSLFVPELVLEYYPQIKEWNLFGDFLIGFYGYDIIKLIEKITIKKVENITGEKF